MALFEGDVLLERSEIQVSASPRVDAFRLFRASHKLCAGAADVLLDNFLTLVELRDANLHMPVHESDDWETIQLGKYTLAFWCHLDA